MNNIGQGWGSHLPLLMWAVARTSGPILEVGVGHHSTPILQELDRLLISIETEKEWADQFPGVVHVESYKKHLEPIAKDFFSVAFLDHSPGSTRAEIATHFIGSPAIVIIHDVEAPDVWEPLSQIVHNWNYNKNYERYRPHTLALWN